MKQHDPLEISVTIMKRSEAWKFLQLEGSESSKEVLSPHTDRSDICFSFANFATLPENCPT